MPNYEIALPPGAKNIKIKTATQEIPVDWYFYRHGKDGSDVIVPLFGGDEFVGEVLEGNWLKGDDGSIQGPFTAKLNGSGGLELTGKSDNAGTWRYGWISNKSKIPFLDDLTIDVHLRLPSHASAYGFQIEFHISNSISGNPHYHSDEIRLVLLTDVSAYKIRITKTVKGETSTLLFDTPVTNSEGIFRIKFEENKSGHNHTHIYYHDGSGVIDESVDEVSGSPFSLDLAINFGYPHFEIGTGETTNRTVSSDFVRVTYPDFKVVYDLDDVDVNKGDVKVWDTMGSSDEFDWQRVFDVNHQFVGDCVVENGLIRLWINGGTHQGLKFYWWNGSSWTLQTSDFGIHRVNDCDYPFLLSLNSVSTESASVNIRLEDTSTQDSDYFVDIQITLRRGSYVFEIDFQRAYPSGAIEPDLREFGGGFIYVQDDLIGGGKVGLTANNPTMTDNHIIAFNDTGNSVLVIVATNKKPAGGSRRFRSWMGTTIELETIDFDDIEATKMYLMFIPFGQVANLFKEAEDATLYGGATVDTTQTDDSGDSVLLDAPDEMVFFQLVGDLDLPKGRYLIVVRAKDTNQVTNDLVIVARNVTDSSRLEESNTWENYYTLTSSFAYYTLVFDIDDDDVGDTLEFQAKKITTNANSIYIDYFLIIPISNGESWPQDLAHNALRTYDKRYKVYKR